MLVYYSNPKTNNTKKMLSKLDLDIPFVSIYDYDRTSKYILVTPTYGQGDIPDEVDKFLRINSENMIAVIAGGNKNWGKRFARSGNLISEKYKVPLLIKFELKGMRYEIPQIRKVIGEFYGIYQTEQ